MGAFPAPAGYLRDGVDPADCIPVPLSAEAGAPCVLIRPARCTAADLLAGRASPYAVAAVRLRDAHVRATKPGGVPADGVAIASLAVEALRDTYDAPPEVVDAWLTEPTAVLAISTAALGVGDTGTKRERGRARALVAAGFGGVPLSAMEAAALADWAANAGRAPGWG